MDVVIDTSAIVAAYRMEDDASRFWAVFESNAALHLPAICYLESVMVLRQWSGSRQWLDRFVSDHQVRMLGVDPAQARLAADAFERYGRGSGHPAKLNFGDCLAYAAAMTLGAPLLFKGGDFALTDVRPALAAS